jgi:hypothetical protein
MTVEEWIKFVLQSNVIAALVVGAFGILTLKLGLGKFRSEKWWERKAAAYVSTFEAMHAVYGYAKAVVDAEGVGHDLSESHLTELSNGSLKGLLEIRKAASLAPFLMSKRASMIVSQLVRELGELDPSQEPIIELHRAEMVKVYDAIVSLTKEAKLDLRTP